MNVLGNGHGETLLIGDTVHDFEVAQSVGADCRLISGGHQNKKTLEKTGAVVYSSLNEFIEAEF